MLVVQGTTDLQVTVADATRLAKAQPRAKLVVLEGMNHVLKPVGGSGAAQLPSYSDPTLKIASDVYVLSRGRVVMHVPPREVTEEAMHRVYLN